jgi:hypothetical protein
LRFLDWGYNGPLIFINLIKSYCDSVSIDELVIDDNDLQLNQSVLKNDCDVIAYPQSYFYPYSYMPNDIQLLFAKNNKDFNKSIFDRTYSIHFFGKVSDNYHVEINDFSIYEQYAKIHCPIVYNEVKNNNLNFE